MKENILYPIAFTGYQEDRISGLCYAQARYYSPDNGRFISEDIVRGVPTMPDTVNHYLYCLNDPKVYVDKDGAFLHILAGAAAGALTGAVVAGVHSVLTEGHVDWAAVGGAAIGGAVTGAVVTACPAAAPAAVGALGGGTTSLATGILKGESAGQIAKDTVIGTVTGAIGGKLFQGIGATLGKGVSNVATKAFGQTAGKIVGETVTSGLGGGAINVGFSFATHKMQGQSYGLSDAAKDFGVGMADGVAGYATHRASSLGFNKLATMAEQTNAGKTINGLANKAANKIGNAYGRFGVAVSRGAGAVLGKITGTLRNLAIAVLPKMGSASPITEMCLGESGSSIADKGYTQDEKGRWHRPNGQYASKEEVKIPVESAEVQDIISKTSMEMIRKDATLRSFDENFEIALEKAGLTKDDYIRITRTPLSKMDGESIKTLATVNNSVKNPDNGTLLSKVISEDAYKNYMKNGNYSDTVGNCLTRAQDMQDCVSFDDYYDSLGLNYKNNPFDNADKLYVMRFTSNDTEALVTRSYGGTSPLDVERAKIEFGLNDQNSFLNDDPYLGTGVTKDVKGGLGKMELMTQKKLDGSP
ncbi:MAG: RHS repeat-associated core domain-containing protein, partial [Lachnospiraceae bacterium]|nr:RHS repeat-associated core domain-containing protein [Lachnospiraceae bacterium]